MKSGRDESIRPAAKLRYLVPIVAVFVILLIAVFGDPEDPWRKFLKEWETLITGGAAIAAAMITVGQMRRSDLRSDRRHEDLMAIQFRKDVKKLLQFVDGRGSELSELAWLLQLEADAARNDVQNFQWPANSHKIGTYLARAEKALTSEEAEDILELLPPEVFADRSMILHVKRDISLSINALAIDGANLEPDAHRLWLQHLTKVDGIAEQTAEVVRGVEAVAYELSARIYR